MLRLGAASVIQAPVRQRRLVAASTSVPAGSRDPARFPTVTGTRISKPIEQTVRVPGSRQVKGEAADGIP